MANVTASLLQPEVLVYENSSILQIATRFHKCPMYKALQVLNVQIPNHKFRMYKFRI